MSAPPGGKTSSAAQSNLQPGPTEWHMHGPELEGEDGQGGVMREGAEEREVVITRQKEGMRGDKGIFKRINSDNMRTSWGLHACKYSLIRFTGAGGVFSMDR